MEKPSNPAEGVFNEVGGVAVAAILHMLRLVAADLVLIRGTDPTRFEEAVHAKLNQFTSPTNDVRARETGLACARHLVDQVLQQIRAQADIKKSLGASDRKSATRNDTEPTQNQPPMLLH
jgi:hypothetical protein